MIILIRENWMLLYTVKHFPPHLPAGSKWDTKPKLDSEVYICLKVLFFKYACAVCFCK